MNTTHADEMIKVMIVDDEPYIRQGLQVLIGWEELGFRTIEQAADGVEALEKLQATPVDLVIADIKMPRMDGIELAEQIAKQHAGTKIIFLSGYYEFEMAKAAIRCGVVDYILKPIKKAELIRALEIFRSDYLAQLRSWSALESLLKHRVQPEVLDGCGVDAYRYIHSSAGAPGGHGGAYGEDTEPGWHDDACASEAGSSGFDYKHVLDKVEEEIRHRYHEQLNLKVLGRKYFMSSVYLGQIFKKKYGVSFKEYLNNYRIQCAAERLLSGNERVYEIALAVGYNNTDYFIRRFLQQMGQTPYQYRLSSLNVNEPTAVHGVCGGTP